MTSNTPVNTGFTKGQWKTMFTQNQEAESKRRRRRLVTAS